jgi:hypothetical protein
MKDFFLFIPLGKLVYLINYETIKINFRQYFLILIQKNYNRLISRLILKQIIPYEFKRMKKLFRTNFYKLQSNVYFK